MPANAPVSDGVLEITTLYFQSVEERNLPVVPLKVCHCCGGCMEAAASCNPNVCAGCAQLLDDESSAQVARIEDAFLVESVLVESAGNRSPWAG